MSYRQAYITVQMPSTNFELKKPKLAYTCQKANCYIQSQSTLIGINFHLLVRALKICIVGALHVLSLNLDANETFA